MLSGARGLAARAPVRGALVAAMVLGLLLAGALVVKNLVEAQAQNPQQRDAAQTPPDRPSGPDVSPDSPNSSRLLRRAEEQGSVRVIVGLRTGFVPEGRLSGARIAVQRDAIDDTRAALRADLTRTGYRTLREYNTVPYVVLTLSPRAFRALQRSPLVSSITEDVAFETTLAESTGTIKAPTMWTKGYTGAGQTVAVLDTGVDSSHPFLAGKVVEEACYSENEDCPNGGISQTGPGAGAPCAYAPEGCEHGTHVAGIAAGQDPGSVGFSGVARGANIMSVQVFSRREGSDCEDEDGMVQEDPCTKSFESDQIAALERVYAVRNTHDIAAVNMSLGGGEYAAACDAEFPALKAAMDNLYYAGIPTVVASGNSGFKNAVAAPACISTAVSVGSTTDADEVSSFSNSGTMLSFLAPGSGINASVTGGGYEVKNGTSMAAPHAAGAFAILKQMNPEGSLSDIHKFMLQNGTAVTDGRAGGAITRQRIGLSVNSTFVVNSTDNVSRFGWWQRFDTQEGFYERYLDDGCNEKECTLREAINAADAMPNFAEPDRIEFDIPGSGVRTIELDRLYIDTRYPQGESGELPTLVDPVTIDGYTQPGSSDNTRYLGQGTDAKPLVELSGLYSGLRVFTDNATIRGLVINHAYARDSLGYGSAIYIRGSDNVVAGNFVGTDPEGNKKNSDDSFQWGLHIRGGADNTIGGTQPADRNVIAGNSGADIFLDGSYFPREHDVAGTTIRSNYIGTNADGTAAVDSSNPFTSGILLRGGGGGAEDAVRDTTIGGVVDNVVVGNLISGHEQTEIALAGAAVTGGVIQGNRIGTKRDAETAIVPGSSTSGTGIHIGDSSGFKVGGLDRREGNVIAFKATGVNIVGPSNTNGAGDGNDISGNSIHSNGSLGINLALGGEGTVTRNDLNDSDRGPNQEQNFPVLTSAPISGRNAMVSGTLNSTANTTFRLEFFANDACEEAQHHGEGQTFIGTANVTTDASGNASFDSLSFDALPSQPVITATATDPNGNTSEFSQCPVPPRATNDSYSTDADEPLEVDAPGVLSNDTGLAYFYHSGSSTWMLLPTNKPLTAAVEDEPAHGDLTLEPDGSFAYTPDAGYSGADSFTYKANDGTNDSDPATVNIAVREEPPPTLTAPADQESYEGVEEDFELGSFEDPSAGSPWRVSVDWGDGSDDTTFTTNSPGSLGQKPHAYASSDSDPTTQENDPYTVTVTVTEGGQNPDSDTETFRVAVNEDPAPRLYVYDPQQAYEDQEQYIYPGYIEDPGTGTPYTVEVDWGDGSTETFSNEPYYGSRPWFYLDAQPHAYAGTDSDPTTPEDDPYTVTVTVTEGDANSSSDTETFRVEVSPEPPRTEGDTYYVDRERPLTVDAPGVLGNDGDPQGDPLTAELANAPSRGTLDLRPDGSLTYTPDAGFSVGYDYAYYRACDPGGSCSDWTHIELINEGPQADDDEATTGEDTPVEVDVLGNDAAFDGRGSLDPSSVGVVTQPNHGGATVDAATGRITYTPDADFNGADEFTYEVCDEGDPDPKCDAAKVDVTVDPINDAPDARDDAVTASVETPVVIDVKANDAPGPTNETGQTLAVDAINAPPARGTAEITADGPDAGKVRYTPDARYSGPDEFAYSVCDDGEPAGCDTAKVTVTVSPAPPTNDAPDARPDAYDVNEDGVLAADAPGVLGNDDDPDDDPITAERVSGPADGTLDLRPDGAFSYTPDNNSNGSDAFTYRACDSADPRACSEPATVTITVNPANDDPIANDDTASADEGGPPVVVDVLQNDDDGPDAGETLSIASVERPPAGEGATEVVTGSGPDKVRFTPDADSNGRTSFGYTVSDGNGGADTANVTVSVAATNDAPTVDLSGENAAREGDTKAYTYAVTPGDDPTPEITEKCGENATRNDTPRADHFECVFPDGPANTTVSVEAGDGAGGVVSDTIGVGVANAAPTLTAPAGQSSRTGENKEFELGSFADPGADGDWRVTVAWGDGSADTTFAAAAPGSLGRKPHAYATSGAKTVTVTVAEAGGSPSDSETFRVDVSTPADTTRPTVTSVTPHGTPPASPATNATATFSEAMGEASVKASGVFTLGLQGKKGKTTRVPATVSYNANTRTLTLDPTAAKLKKGTYTARITTGAKDLAGNALAQDKTWTFTVKK